MLLSVDLDLHNNSSCFFTNEHILLIFLLFSSNCERTLFKILLEFCICAIFSARTGVSPAYDGVDEGVSELVVPEDEGVSELVAREDGVSELLVREDEGV